MLNSFYIGGLCEETSNNILSLNRATLNRKLVLLKFKTYYEKLYAMRLLNKSVLFITIYNYIIY